MTRFLPVAGTHGWSGRPEGGWWQLGSPWLAYMRTHDFVPYNGARPFVWSTQLAGHRFWRRWLGLQDPHLVWQSAGDNLWAYIVPPLYGGADNGVAASPAQTRIVAHSHAAQVVAYACAYGLKVDRLITVGSPVRADMAAIYDRARPNIAHWLHLHSDASDRWQWLGSIGDGAFGIVREHRWADENRPVPMVGHSGLLDDEDAFLLWQCNGYLEALRG